VATSKEASNTPICSPIPNDEDWDLLSLASLEDSIHDNEDDWDRLSDAASIY
jgi:hypothetical protein